MPDAMDWSQVPKGGASGPSFDARACARKIEGQSGFTETHQPCQPSAASTDEPSRQGPDAVPLP